VIRRLLRSLRRTDRPESEVKVIPGHESPVRRMLADADGAEYVAYATRAEAAADPDAAMVLEGDWGGQIYVACPLTEVAASDEALTELLVALDRLAWPYNDADGRQIRFERAAAGSGVAGGMGGGCVDRTIWVHEEFVAAGLDEQIREVVRGRRARVDRPV
jgi:hypothetical protein